MHSRNEQETVLHTLKALVGAIAIMIIIAVSHGLNGELFTDNLAAGIIAFLILNQRPTIITIIPDKKDGPSGG